MTRAVLRTGIVVVALTGLGLLSLLWTFAGHINRVDGAFAGLEESERPLPAAQLVEGSPAGGGAVAAPGTTFLVAGTDSRSPVPTTGTSAGAPAWEFGAQRTDSLMLTHLTADGDRAYVVSIPRDSWVPVPGLGHRKINSAYSLGGPSLMVRTVEQLTGVRVDHVAIVDWHGVARLVDALGGLELDFAGTTVARERVWTAGTHRLRGNEVADYVSERLRLPDGDFGRIARQQEVLRAIAEELVRQDLLGDPLRTLRSAQALARSVSFDETLGISDIVSLGVAARQVDPSQVLYLTAPISGTGQEGAESVVYLDESRLGGFCSAFERGELEQWVATHRGAAA